MTGQRTVLHWQAPGRGINDTRHDRKRVVHGAWVLPALEAMAGGSARGLRLFDLRGVLRHSSRHLDFPWPAQRSRAEVSGPALRGIHISLWADASRTDGDAMVANLRNSSLREGGYSSRLGSDRRADFPLIPKAVAIPSPLALQNANNVLRQEISAHEETLRRLREAQEELERKVVERTSELERAKRRFEALVAASAQIFWAAQPDGSITEDSPSWRAFTGQTYDEWKGTGWLEALHPEDRATALAAWTQAVGTNEIYNVEYRLKHTSGEYRWTAARGVPLIESDGKAREWVGMNVDITERKESEEYASLIMRELSHRTKNLLAIIASLVRRTIDGKRDPVVQAGDFIERIHGLARSHDLLVRGEWRGVSLHDLVSSHLEPFGAVERATISGPLIEVRPEAAQNIGLALHELATNAVKHGALQKDDKLALVVTWSIATEDGEQSLVLTWLEETRSREPAEGMPAGFGRTMLEQLVAAAVRGTAHYELTENHVRWSLRAPLRNIVGASEDLAKEA